MKKKSSSIFFIFLVIAIFPLLFYLLLRAKYFVILTIDCSQDAGSCSTDVIAELERYRGANSLFLDTPKISEKIKRADATIRTADVAIRLPRTLSVNIIGRIPNIQFALSTDFPHVFFADEDAIITGSGAWQETLPLILLEQMEGPTIGEKLQDQLRIGIALVTDLHGQLSVIDHPMIKNDLLLITLADGIRVRFSLSKSRTQQLAALQLLLNQARIGEIHYREIDLRFSQPIVKK